MIVWLDYEQSVGQRLDSLPTSWAVDLNTVFQLREGRFANMVLFREHIAAGDLMQPCPLESSLLKSGRANRLIQNIWLSWVVRGECSEYCILNADTDHIFSTQISKPNLHKCDDFFQISKAHSMFLFL